MQENMRLFVAVPLPQDLKRILVSARQTYDLPGIKAVPKENLHLTLFFIGSVPAYEVPAIKQKLTEVAQRHDPFTLSLLQLEAGPKPKAPRLIWARFQLQEAFTNLSLDLTQILSSAPPEHGKFIPHVTLHRFKRDFKTPSLPIVVLPQEVLFQVGSLALWQSQLASPHPVYTVVEEYPLGIVQSA